MRVAFFISGGGTTMKAAITAAQQKRIPSLQPAMVIASTKNAGGIQKAQALGVKTLVVSPKEKDSFARRLLQVCDEHTIELISQNGWLVHTPAEVVARYEGRLINQHPGPLDPGRTLDFGGRGMYGARVVCARLLYSWLSGEDFWTEATTHYVTEEYDKGDILRTIQLNYEHHHTTREEIVKNAQQIIDATYALQKKLLPLEHENVISTLKDYIAGKKHSHRRGTSLVPKKNAAVLEFAKTFAIKLFPHG